MPGDERGNDGSRWAGPGDTPGGFTVFRGQRWVVHGSRAMVLEVARELARARPEERVAIFEDRTGEPIEWDEVDRRDSAVARGDGGGSQGADAGVVATPPRGPGRPRLGVVAREVTLLPRHWEWLATQPGGASVALRKLVEQARKSGQGVDERRRAREAAYRFMAVAGGDLPGFEEAIRALFAGNRTRFDAELAAWPEDFRAYAGRLAAGSFGSVAGPAEVGAEQPKPGG